MSLPFDPFAPGALKSNFLQAKPDQRAELLAEALQGMAEGLRGISSVVELAYADPDNFILGLTRALAQNPANLTAARARIWFCIRHQRWREAEDAYTAMDPSWANYGELLIERLRLSIVGEGVAEPGQAFDAYKKHLQGAAFASYRLQAVENLPEDNRTHLVGTLLSGGASALRNMLTLPDEKAPYAIKQSEYRALWHFSKLILGARRIALVGNAATLTGRGHGRSIDHHDIVIRCNYPAIKDHADDVGKRTSIMFLNESTRATLLKRRQALIEFADAPVIGLHPEPHFGLPTDAAFADVEGVGTLPAPVRRFVSDISYCRATTGLLAICLLVFVFNKRISLYGFDFFGDAKRPHYYGNQVGAWLGHELQYERWYVTEFVPRHWPAKISLA